MSYSKGFKKGYQQGFNAAFAMVLGKVSAAQKQFLITDSVNATRLNMANTARSV